jgi:predicted transcriptional regulator
MSKRANAAHLSRRERQIMDVVYRNGRATAAEVHTQIPDPPSYSAVRAMLRVLEDKGHLRHESQGLAYVYSPTISPETARRSAVSHLLRTFFDGSPERAVAAVLQSSDAKLSPAELDRMAALIEAARKEGR